MIDPLTEHEIVNIHRYMSVLSENIHDNAIAHGWWEEERPFGELIALIHAEASEALEADRDGDDVAEELADVIIRVLDTAAGMEIPVIEALIKKVEYNRHRPYKHGKLY